VHVRPARLHGLPGYAGKSRQEVGAGIKVGAVGHILCIWQDKTEETIGADGWLKSGDVAACDEDGFWRITGRIKELIITAGGENIPPVLIEVGDLLVTCFGILIDGQRAPVVQEEFKDAMKAVSNCMVVGDRQKYLTIMLTVKTRLDALNQPTDSLSEEVLKIGQQLGSTAKTVAQLTADPLVRTA
jgi:long-chain-fatty-acid--CoA ligase ACSBG